MANLGLIDFKLCLYIKVDVNTGQNKFEVSSIYMRPLYEELIKSAKKCEKVMHLSS